MLIIGRARQTPRSYDARAITRMRARGRHVASRTLPRSAVVENCRRISRPRPLSSGQDAGILFPAELPPRRYCRRSSRRFRAAGHAYRCHAMQADDTMERRRASGAKRHALSARSSPSRVNSSLAPQRRRHATRIASRLPAGEARTPVTGGDDAMSSAAAEWNARSSGRRADARY